MRPPPEALAPNDPPSPAALRERLAATRLRDRPHLMRELQRLLGMRSRTQFAARAWALAMAMDASAARVEGLRSLPLQVEPDPALPISAHRTEFLAALEQHPVVIVCGATGSGKSTQLPKLCLAAGRGALGLIGHTQPRRIAARTLAARLATELGTRIGAAVGYQVRFSDRTGPDCRVKLMTDGILLRELSGDPELARYDTLILDEAHERSLNLDLLLGALQRLIRRRADLRVVVTSATIDPDKLARFFGGAPVLEVSGRSYPVEVRYRPLAAEDEDAAELSLPEGIVAAVRELVAADGAAGDVLVFLPGEKQIREAAEALRRAALAGLEIVPLFARLSSEQQDLIFAPHAQRRVVLATNVAETSLTVPGIRFVVDSGLARISRYSLRGKVQRLPIERIARASAEQRKGRCGREAAGVCIRLYSEADFAAREEYTPPEVLRTNLASVILQMAASGLGEPESFPFPDPPDTRLVNDGVRLLQEFKAMDAERGVTSLGRQLAALPCDPRLARILVAAARHRCLSEMLIVAAFLETQDPRERPADRQAQADESHASFADPRSDFLAVLNLWRAYQAQSELLSGRELRRWCREHFVSFVRMREWQDLHAQLEDASTELGLERSTSPASYKGLHQAVLTGFLGQIGHLDEGREYRGARGARFVIAPGTPLAARPPRWVVAASLTETTRVYARMAAAVEPVWIEAAAAHLTRRTYSGAHWAPTRGSVLAYEAVALYGLTLASQRRINYAAVAPREAHEIFLRDALVDPRSDLQLDFLQANRRLRAEIERIEAKIRRRDVLASDEVQVEFYRARIPEHVSSIAALERWWREIRADEPQRLQLTAGELMRRPVPELEGGTFPDELAVGANRLPLRYVFEPSAPDDGITLLIPQALCEQLDPEQLAWLVPGARHEKITTLLRALPKAIRKQLVPVPEQAQTALDALAAQQRPGGALAAGGELPPFHEWLAAWVSHVSGTAVGAAELAALPLAAHLRLNVRVLPTGAFAEAATRASSPEVLAEGRDVAAIKRRVRALELNARTTSEPQAALHREWDFGELPESLDVERGGVRLSLYPAIVDRGNGVARLELASRTDAEALSRRAAARLAVLALPQQARDARRRIADDRKLVLLALGLPLARALPEALCDRVFGDCFAPPERPLPRSRAQFEAAIAAHRAELVPTLERTVAAVRTLLAHWRAIRAALAELHPRAFAAAIADIEDQLAGLLPPDFIEATAAPWVEELDRYLQAIRRRIARLAGNLARDAELMQRVQPFVAALGALAAQPLPPHARAATQQLRWMIEEFRVSLFAQELKTRLPVSEKRLAEQLERARKAVGT